MKKSTKDLFRLHGWKNIGLFMHGYIYLSKIKMYVFVAIKGGLFLVKHSPSTATFFLNWIVPRYHSKVVLHEDAKKFVTLNKDISVEASISKKVIPFEIAHQIMFKNPSHITVMDCPCRQVNKNHCSSPRIGTQVCLMIGEPQASFVFEHAAYLHPRRISHEEALAIVKEAHDCGWVHTIWLKDAIGARTFAMCNCCKCCCGGMLAMHILANTSIKLKDDKRPILSSGYVAKVSEEKCISCGVCEDICPFNACSLDSEANTASINYDRCMGCGVCVDKCSESALALMRDETKGIPLDLDELQIHCR